VANRCYRCGTETASWRSFCDDCQRHHGAGLNATPHARESRVWVLTVVAPLVSTAALAGVALGGPDPLVVVALLAVATYLGAVYVDYRHLRGHEADWTPTSWVYSVGLVAALLTLGLSALAFTPYHLSRRRAAVGLPT
jgi:hypothetical protein